MTHQTPRGAISVSTPLYVASTPDGPVAHWTTTWTIEANLYPDPLALDKSMDMLNKWCGTNSNVTNPDGTPYVK